MLQKQHTFWCPEHWKSHFQAARFQVFLGCMSPDPLGERDLMAALVITDTSYTFSGRLQLMFIETPVSIN